MNKELNERLINNNNGMGSKVGKIKNCTEWGSNPRALLQRDLNPPP